MMIEIKKFRFEELHQKLSRTWKRLMADVYAIQLKFYSTYQLKKKEQALKHKTLAVSRNQQCLYMD